MIELAGGAERSYLVPVPLAVAFGRHRDFPRSVDLLPHITLVAALGPDRWRLRYAATEAGLYRVRIDCDVQAVVDEEAHRILVLPLPQPSAADGEAGLYSMAGRGNYRSEIRFAAEGPATRVTTRLSLSARLPVARSLRWLPQGVVAAAAGRIVQRRIEEILGRFIERSLAEREPRAR
jgi:hypothetical protein